MSQKSSPAPDRSPVYRYRVRRVTMFYVDKEIADGWAAISGPHVIQSYAEDTARYFVRLATEDGFAVDPEIPIVTADGSPWEPGR